MRNKYFTEDFIYSVFSTSKKLGVNVDDISILQIFNMKFDTLYGAEFIKEVFNQILSRNSLTKDYNLRANSGIIRGMPLGEFVINLMCLSDKIDAKTRKIYSMGIFSQSKYQLILAKSNKDLLKDDVVKILVKPLKEIRKKLSKPMIDWLESELLE